MKARNELKRLMNEHYAAALRVKQSGGLVGWCSSNFPQEIAESLGLTVVFPENHAAMLAAAGEGKKYCDAAENRGYSNDLCSYARINLGYCESFDSQVQNIPKPDFLLCCSNTCHQLIKWYEILAHQFSVPLFFLDIPYTMQGEPDETAVSYLDAQFREIVRSLCAFADVRFDPVKFIEVMRVSAETGRLWQEAIRLAGAAPSPLNGFDLFVYMSAAVCIRGKRKTAEAFRLLVSELRARIAEGKSSYPGEQKFRVAYEGVACWPYLYQMQFPMIESGINIVSAIYADTFAVVYDGFRELLLAYANIPNSIPLPRGLARRREALRQTKCDGIAFHMTRTCKMWCGCYYEMERRLSDEGVSTLIFDGDQADGKNFSFAQYETRVQAFAEMLAESKGGRSWN